MMGEDRLPMPDDDITIGELRRRLDRLERNTISKDLLDSRHQVAEEWRQEHDIRHSNQWKAIGGVALGIIGKILADWITAGGP